MQAALQRHRTARGLGVAGWLWVASCSPGAGQSTETATTQAPATSADTSDDSDASAAGSETSTDTGASSSDTSAHDPGWHVELKLGPEDGALLSVWGSAPDDVFVVGGQPESGDDPGRAIAYHFTDETWSPLLLPDATPRLNWIHGTAATRWAVGERGVILRRAAEDDAWTPEDSGTQQTLWGVWGIDDDQLWTVGGDGGAGTPTLLRRAGGSWTAVSLPTLPVDSKGLFKIWGASATDIHAVGDLGLLLHGDGDAWEVQDNASIADLISVWGAGTGDALAVGGRSSARLSRWDGATWTGLTFDEEPGLSGVWVDAVSGEATVVGDKGLIARVAAGTLDLVRDDSPTMHFLHAVTGFADGTRLAVGGSLVAPPPHVGVVLRYTPPG